MFFDTKITIDNLVNYWTSFLKNTTLFEQEKEGINNRNIIRRQNLKPQQDGISDKKCSCHYENAIINKQGDNDLYLLKRDMKNPKRKLKQTT